MDKNLTIRQQLEDPKFHNDVRICIEEGESEVKIAKNILKMILFNEEPPSRETELLKDIATLTHALSLMINACHELNIQKDHVSMQKITDYLNEEFLSKEKTTIVKKEPVMA